jgi:replicative DNA helicase
MTPEKEIESGVLGALLLEKTPETKAVMAFLKPKVFAVPQHQIIFRAIEYLSGNDTPVDILTVTHLLRDKKQLDRVGGPLYISQLTNRVASSAHIESHARIIFQNYILREIGQVSTGLINKAIDPSSDPFQLLDEAERALFEIKEGIYAGQDNMKSVKEILPDINKSIDRRLSGEMIGLPTGFPEINRVLHGWVNSDLIYVGGRPGSGKSSFLLTSSILLGLMGVPTAIFSLEMSKEQLVGRLISQIIEVPYGDIMLKQASSETLERYHSMMGKIERLPIWIDDTPALTISEIRRRTMKAVDKYGAQMVFADYAQLIRGTDKRSGNREQEMAEVSRGLKQCAKENNIPVMAAAQLSRSKNEKEKPTLQSFRESGAYEQDGDVVIFPYRAEYYGILEDENGESTEGKAEMIIAKHRNGGLGNPVINFVARLTKFESGEVGSKDLPHPDSFIESKVRPNNKFLGDDAPF